MGTYLMEIKSPQNSVLGTVKRPVNAGQRSLHPQTPQMEHLFCARHCLAAGRDCAESPPGDMNKLRPSTDDLTRHKAHIHPAPETQSPKP